MNPISHMLFVRALHLLLSALLLVYGTNLCQANGVPNTLEEAFVFLNTRLTTQEKEHFRKTSEQEAVTSAHMGLGMYIRNEWFRSGSSALPSWLRGLGARHIDDMTAMILTSYWRHLNGRPIQIEQQGTCYRKWWEEQHRIIEAAKAKGETSHGTASFVCP